VTIDIARRVREQPDRKELKDAHRRPEFVILPASQPCGQGRLVYLPGPCTGAQTVTLLNDPTRCIRRLCSSSTPGSRLSAAWCWHVLPVIAKRSTRATTCLAWSSGGCRHLHLGGDPARAIWP